MEWLIVLISLLVLATSLWAMFDTYMLSNRAEAVLGHENYVGKQLPVFWLLACVVCWIVFFPLYVVVRSSFASALEEAESAEQPEPPSE